MIVETRHLWLKYEDIIRLLNNGEVVLDQADRTDADEPRLIGHLHVFPRDCIAAKELVGYK